MSTITKEQVIQIEAAAKEVLWPIVWTEKKARTHFSQKVTPEVVLELARIARAYMDIKPPMSIAEEQKSSAAYMAGEGRPNDTIPSNALPQGMQVDIEMLASALRNVPLAPSDSQGTTRTRVVKHQITGSMAKDIALKLGAELNDEEADIFADGYNAAVFNAEPLRAIQTAPVLDLLNKNAAPLHATPKGNRLRIAEGEFAAYFPQERPVSGARVIAWDESGHLLGIGFGRDTRESGIAIIVEGKKYDSNHVIHWCNYPAIPEGLNIRAIAALRAAVRDQWLKSDNFADKVYWKSMHSIANEIVEAMMQNEPHQPTDTHIPSREAIIAGGVLVQCPRCHGDSYRLNFNGWTHFWCDKCASAITSEGK
ncbi:hypothetical protein D7X38_21165 [Salmonella enterica]|nr:hypothetical protein [Salmonella enterica]EHN7880926.1 hypothetical protein [Salmonella enterica]